MSSCRLLRWAAWAPQIETHDDWYVWSREPHQPAGDDAPGVRFLPPLQRRRCDLLSRMMLQVARQCCEDSELAAVGSVFASRHGSFATTVSLLEDLAADAALSPTRFSHSVHNTQAGLFSIWSGCGRPSTSLSAGAETFAHGFLEALGMLHRDGGPVLLVTGDEPIPAPLAAISDHTHGAHALALMLDAAETDPPLTCRITRNEGEARKPRVWPDALEFLRWWLSEEKTLRLDYDLRTWVWSRP